jgi:hypothetical protein
MDFDCIDKGLGAIAISLRLKVYKVGLIRLKAFGLGFSYHKRLHAIGIDDPTSFRMRVRYNPNDNTIHKIKFYFIL